MKVAVASLGSDLDSEVSRVFGRCNYFLFVDTETSHVDVMSNPAIGASGGAGVQAAQFVVRQGAEAVLCGNVGPNAMGVLSGSAVDVYALSGLSATQALQRLQEGQLTALASPTVGSDYGKAGPMRGGRGGGRRRR